MDTIKKTLRDHLHSGKAFEKFCDIIEAQGGDRRALEDPSRMPKARFSKEVLIQTSGFIESIDVRALGLAVLALGGGRRKVSDQILPGVGLSGLRRVGSQVRPGETLLTIHGDSQESIDEAANICEGAFHFGAESKADTLILEVMS